MTNLSDNINDVMGGGGTQYLIVQLREGGGTQFVVQGPFSVEDAETFFTALQTAHPDNVYGLVKYDNTYTVIEDAAYPEPQMETVCRDASTGEYVTPEYAAEHPDTTVCEEQPVQQG